MRMMRITTIVFIGVLMVLSACAKPAPMTPTPPIIPTTPTPTTPTTPTTPATPATPAIPATPATPTTPTTPPTPVQGLYDVWIPGREFRPSILTVPVGTNVTWTNKDGEQHTVTSATGIFDASLAFGQSYSYIFTTPGTYEYFCNPHPDMTAKVIVQ